MHREEFALGAAEYRGVLRAAENVVVAGASLPDWVFRQSTGVVDFVEYELAISEELAPVAEALIRRSGDASVSVVVVDPEYSSLDGERSWWPAFTTRAEQFAASYGDLVDYWAGDGVGSILLDADKFLVFGTSGTWAVYADRLWGFALLWSEASDPIWRRSGVDFWTVGEAIDYFTKPNFGQIGGLPEDQRLRCLASYEPHRAASPAGDHLDDGTHPDW